MKRESKKPQDQQNDRNSPEHVLTLLFETPFVQDFSDVIFGTRIYRSAYRRIGVSASGEVKAAFRDRYNDQEVSKELMILRKRRHADTPIRFPSRPIFNATLWGHGPAGWLFFRPAAAGRHHHLCARGIQVIDPLLRSGPNVISAEFCDTDKATDSNLIWLLQLHKTGIGSATLRVIDRTVLPLAVTFLRKARYKNKPNNRKLAFRWIRIVDIGLLFPFSRRRLAQSHALGAKSASTFEQRPDGIGTPPESDRGCSLGRRNCGQS